MSPKLHRSTLYAVVFSAIAYCVNL